MLTVMECLLSMRETPMPDHLTDDDLDGVAQMLIPILDGVAGRDYPDARHRVCKIAGCDRTGYARGVCYPHDQEARRWTTAR